MSRFFSGAWAWLGLLIVLSACQTVQDSESAASDSTTRPTNAAANEAAQPNVTIEPEATDPGFGSTWKTDWSRHTIAYSDLVVGHPQRDGIPPIDKPTFEAAADVDWLHPEEPVVLVSLAGETKVYPIQILMWHEIVNDTIGGVPVAVTFCPLCNTALVFDRRVSERELTFGVSGLLRHSDLVMWDRQTESLWQQATGAGLVGELAGEQLTLLPATQVPWATAQIFAQDIEVLSRDTGFDRQYGHNPYSGYDSSERPFLLKGPPDDRLPAMTRIVGIYHNDEAVTYPFDALGEQPVVHDLVGGKDVVIFFEQTGRSALDEASIERGRVVGTGTAWEPVVDGQQLSFEWRDGMIRDQQTGSSWNITGQAIEGELAGTQLEPVIHANHFWFAWAALNCAQAETCRIWEPTQQ